MLDIAQRIAIEYVILPVLLSIVTAAIGWASVQWQKWTGQQIEEKKKRDLHDAASNAIRWAIQTYLDGKAPTTSAQRDTVIEQAPAYLADKIPDALKYFNINAGGSEVRDILMTKLPIPGMAEVKK